MEQQLQQQPIQQLQLQPMHDIAVSAISTTERLLEIAVTKDFDIEKLERLMAMHKEWESNEARKKFYAAIAKFQKICPPLLKSKKVKYTTKTGLKIEYDYTPLGEIDSLIKDPLSQCGLSKRWEYATAGQMRVVKCMISHEAGHSESSKLDGQIDTSGNKSALHGQSSTDTYLMRRTLIGALGIATADADDDAQHDNNSGGSAQNHNAQQGQQGQQTKQINYYPQVSFDVNFEAWNNLIASGKKTAEEIITTVSTKGTLSQAQIKKLKACK